MLSADKPSLKGLLAQLKQLKLQLDGYSLQEYYPLNTLATDTGSLKIINEIYLEICTTYNRLNVSPSCPMKHISISTAPSPTRSGSSTFYVYDDAKRTLTWMRSESTKAVEALSSLLIGGENIDQTRIIPINDEFNSYKEELPSEHRKNCEEAIRELENGSVLASAFLSTRGFEVARAQLFQEKKEEEIISILIKERAIPEDQEALRDSIHKGLRKARNNQMHKVTTFPSGNDALGLLSDYVSFLKTVKGLF